MVIGTQTIVRIYATNLAAAVPHHTRALVARNPDLLHRENAVGRTPAEVARDMAAASRLATLVAEPVTATVVLNGRRIDDLGDKHPGWFEAHHQGHGEKNCNNGKPRPNRELVWDVVQTFLGREEAEGGRGKRRLVSLNEASDVARRLGETYMGQRYHQYGKGDGKGGGNAAAASRGDGDEEKKQEEPDFVTQQYNKVKSKAWTVDGDDDEEGTMDDDVSPCLECGKMHGLETLYPPAEFL